MIARDITKGKGRSFVCTLITELSLIYTVAFPIGSITRSITGLKSPTVLLTESIHHKMAVDRDLAITVNDTSELAVARDYRDVDELG